MDLINFVELIETYNKTLTNVWKYHIIDIKEDNGYVIQLQFVFYTSSSMYNMFKTNICIPYELCEKQTESIFNYFIQTRLQEYILAGMLKYIKEEIPDTFFNIL